MSYIAHAEVSTLSPQPTVPTDSALHANTGLPGPVYKKLYAGYQRAKKDAAA